jgi:hypothetical protein
MRCCRPPRPAWWHSLLRQFRNPLIYILGVAAIVSLALWEGTDAAFISAVLGVNALIGGYQEWRAEKSTRALQKLLQMHATVVRDGEMLEINAEAVVCPAMWYGSNRATACRPTCRRWRCMAWKSMSPCSRASPYLC